MSTTTSTVPLGANWPLAAVLGLGPVATVMVLSHAIAAGSLTAVAPATYLGAALLFWSPLPFSVPAVLLDTHRDEALTGLRGPVGWVLRAVLLVPYLMTSPRSVVRTEMTASVLGWVAAVVLAWPQVGPHVSAAAGALTRLAG